MGKSCISNSDPGLISLQNETNLKLSTIKPIIQLWRGSIESRQDQYPSLQYVLSSVSFSKDLHSQAQQSLSLARNLVLNSTGLSEIDPLNSVNLRVLELKSIVDNYNSLWNSDMNPLLFSNDNQKELEIRRISLGINTNSNRMMLKLMSTLPLDILKGIHVLPLTIATFYRLTNVVTNTSNPLTWSDEVIDSLRGMLLTDGQLDYLKQLKVDGLLYDQLESGIRNQLLIINDFSQLNQQYNLGVIALNDEQSRTAFTLTHEFGHMLEDVVYSNPEYGNRIANAIDFISGLIQNVNSGELKVSDSLRLLVQRYVDRLEISGYNVGDTSEILLDLLGLSFMSVNAGIEQNPDSYLLLATELFVNHDLEIMKLYERGFRNRLSDNERSKSFLQIFRKIVSDLANLVWDRFQNIFSQSGHTVDKNSFINFVAYNSMMAINDPGYILDLRTSISGLVLPGQFNGPRTDLELTEAHEQAKKDGVFDPDKHVYMKDGLIYTSVTTLMTEQGVKTYDGKITDEKRLQYEGANLGRDIGTLILLRSLEAVGFPAQDNPTFNGLTISNNLLNELSQHLRNEVVTANGLVITLESMMFSNTGPLRSGSIDLRFSRHDLNDLTITLDIKTRIVKVKYPDGTERTTNGFNDYGRINSFGEYDRFTHAVQLYSYAELERQNGLLRTDGKDSLDAYGTILYEVEVEVDSDGNRNVTSIKPLKVGNDLKIPGFNQIVETNEIRALVDKTMRGTMVDAPNTTKKIQDQISRIATNISVLSQTLRRKGSAALLNRLNDISNLIRRGQQNSNADEVPVNLIRNMLNDVQNMLTMLRSLSLDLAYNPKNMILSLKFLNTLILQLKLFEGVDQFVEFLNQGRQAGNGQALNILNTTNIVAANNEVRYIHSALIESRKRLLAQWLQERDMSQNELFRILKTNELTTRWILLNPGRSIRLNQLEFNDYLNNYINELYSREGDGIPEATIQKFLELFESVDYDVNYLQLWLGAIQDNPDPIVSLVGREYNKVIANIRESEEDFLNELTDLQSEIYNLKGLTRFANPRDVYSDLIDFTDPANPRLIESPDVTFQRELREFLLTPQMDYDSFLVKDDYWNEVDNWILLNSTFDEGMIQAVRARLNDEYMLLLDQNLITQHDYNLLSYARDNKTGDLLPNANDNRSLNSLLTRRKVSQLVLDLFSDVRQSSLNSLRRANNVSQKYSDMMARSESDPIRRMYELLSSTVNRFDSIVPLGARLGSNLPGVNKFSYQLLMDKDFPTFGKLLWRKINPLLLDLNETSVQNRLAQRLVNEQGYILGIIPIYYTNPVPVNLQSFDILKIYGMWFKSANEYVQKQSILPIIELTEHIISSRNVLMTNEEGLPVLRRGTYKTAGNIAQQTLIRSSQNNTLNQFKLWINNVVYDMEYDNSSDFLEAIVKSLLSYTSALRLGFNTLLWTVNIMMGETQNLLKILGNKYVKMKNFNKLHVLYMKEFPKFIQDIGNFKKKSKMNLVTRYFGTFENDYSGGLLETGKQTLLNRGLLFTGQNLGEHYIQSRFVTLYLLETEVTDGNDKVIGNLYDHLILGDNKITLDPKVKGIRVNGTLYTDVNDGQILVMSNMDYLLRNMHGNYKKETKVMIEGYILTKLLYTFRRWVFSTSMQVYRGWVTGLQFSNYTQNTQLGFLTALVVGSRGTQDNARIRRENATARLQGQPENQQITSADSLSRIVTLAILRTLKRAGMQVNDDYLTKLENSILANRLQYDNSPEMREMMASTAMLLLTTAMIIIGGRGIDKKRERKMDISNANWFWYYLINRYRSELLFYVSPLEFNQIIQNPVPATGIFDDFALIWNIIIQPDTWGDTVRSGPDAGRNKLITRIERAVPGYSQIKSLENIENKLKNFQK